MTPMHQQVLLPRVHRRLAILHSKRLHMLHVRLVLHAIQVLVQPVHEILTELLTIVLVIVIELRSKQPHRLLQQSRRQYRIFARVYIVQEGGVGGGNAAAAPQEIVLVDFLDVISLEKVLRYQLDVIDALEDGIHEA